MPPWPTRRRSPRARLVLPPLTGSQAVDLVNLLDQVITAVWRAHGDAMADYLACVDPDSLPEKTPDAIDSHFVPPSSSDDIAL
jgi:hypothetical protein